MRIAVIIMSRVPRPGKTKTRLMSHMNGQECADFHRAALRDICYTVRKSGLDGYIYYAADEPVISEEPAFGLSDSPWSLSDELARHLVLRPQRGNDLGERMKNAAGDLLLEYDAIVLVGSDSPQLSARHIRQTLARLKSHDLVLGPSEDEGYYLLAAKKVYDELFAGIPWGTSGVLKATLAQASSLNLSWALLEPLADIDTWQDLLRFVEVGLTNAGRYDSLTAFQYAKYLSARYAGVIEEDKQ